MNDTADELAQLLEQRQKLRESAARWTRAGGVAFLVVGLAGLTWFIFGPDESQRWALTMFGAGVGWWAGVLLTSWGRKVFPPRR